MTPIYRFKLGINSGTPSLVHPVYKDDLAIQYEKETGQQFFRRKLSGKLDFVGEDYDTIMTYGFQSEYHVYIEMSTDNGQTFAAYWHGRFMRTDCTVNVDDKKISVQPDVIDQYTDILNGWEKEYNLIELAPAIDRVGIWKRPALQVYFLGDNKLTYIVNGLSFEQEVDDSYDAGALVTGMHFGENGRNRDLRMTIDGTLYNIYSGLIPWSGTAPYTVRYNTEDGLTYIYVEFVYMSRTLYQVKRSSDDVVLWEYEGLGDPTEFDLQPKNGSTGTMHCVVTERAVLTRILLDVEQYNGVDTYELSSTDFCYDNRNYRRCLPASLTGSDVFVVNSQFSDTPTEWGRTDDGKYFMKPVSLDPVEFYPIGRSQWINTSMWFRDYGIMDGIEYFGKKKAVVQTNYTLASVIGVLLAKVAPSVSFGETSTYSEILYGTTSFNFATHRLVMTPKSNLLAGEFSQPAMKAEITIRDVLDMLKNMLQCYWYIDGDNRLRIEHVSWFKNGGSYTQVATVGTDLTTMVNSRNGKSWAFATSQYEFNKEDMPVRYQFAWMDEVTEAFTGKPIDIVSKYVKENKVEDVTIANFTSDVDLMLLAPENVSKDGFALFAAVLSSGVYELGIGAIGLTGATAQNYVLALTNLLPKYWTYDLPATGAEIDGQAITVYGTRRNRRQKINIPTGGTDPDPLNLVRTGLGDGQVHDMSINLSSRMAKTTLAYDTEG